MTKKNNLGRPTIENEARSERINFMITPSLKEQLKLGAKMNDTSLNSLLYDICREWLQENKEKVDKFSTAYTELLTDIQKSPNFQKEAFPEVEKRD